MFTFGRGELVEINKMQKHLTTDVLGRSAFCFSSLDSTSTYIRSMWKSLPCGHTVASAEQHSGRGRTGKSFYSPKDSGLYFSFLLKDSKYISDPLFTVKISYALLLAIDEITGTNSAKIKWVNDIYAGQKKVAGILCEFLKDKEKEAIIVGIGVNLSFNKGEAPQEIRNIAGSLENLARKKYMPEELMAKILNQVEKLYSGEITDEQFLSLYRARSAVLGKEINVVKPDGNHRAAALEIADDAGLIVRYENGIMEKLTAGEISIVL